MVCTGLKAKSRSFKPNIFILSRNLSHKLLLKNGRSMEAKNINNRKSEISP